MTVNVPNAITIAAMQEAERIDRDPNVKHYSEVEEAFRELKKVSAAGRRALGQRN